MPIIDFWARTGDNAVYIGTAFHNAGPLRDIKRLINQGVTGNDAGERSADYVAKVNTILGRRRNSVFAASVAPGTAPEDSYPHAHQPGEKGWSIWYRPTQDEIIVMDRDKPWIPRIDQLFPTLNLTAIDRANEADDPWDSIPDTLT